jgi:hypothetical protein
LMLYVAILISFYRVLVRWQSLGADSWMLCSAFLLLCLCSECGIQKDVTAAVYIVLSESTR